MGHEAYSCDILECSGGHPEWHIHGDVLEQLGRGWDMMIGFPPCTYISYAGTAYWNDPGRLEKRLEALAFFAKLWIAPIQMICLENPKSCASPAIAKYSQEIQPYYFGDPHLKTTWLWLKGLPKLEYKTRPDLFGDKTACQKPEPIYISKNGKNLYTTDARSGSREDTQKLRARFWPGIASAMAQQWAGLLESIPSTTSD